MRPDRHDAKAPPPGIRTASNFPAVLESAGGNLFQFSFSRRSPVRFNAKIGGPGERAGFTKGF